MEEARHRPEIIMSLIDIMIDTMERHDLFLAEHPEGGAGRQVIQMQRS